MGLARTILWVTVALAVGAGGGILTRLGARQVADELALRRGSSVAQGTVLGQRVMRSRRAGTSYEVRYRFQLAGAGAVFSHSDATGRRELWAEMEQQAWRATQRGGSIPIAYLARDPWVNRPVAAGGAPLGDAIAGLVLGGVLALSGLISLVAVLRRRGRASAATR